MGDAPSGPARVAAEVAYRAARMIAEEGVVNFAAAIQKAALQMRVTARHSLPDENQVQAAFVAHQALFQSDSQPLECLTLRQIAVAAMHRLSRFSPWLTGAVLDGTANRFSPIELEVVLDDAKQLEMFLLNAGVQFEIRNGAGKLRRNKAVVDQLIYEIIVDETSVCIAVFPSHLARFTLNSRRSHGRMRAQLDEVKSLLSPASGP